MASCLVLAGCAHTEKTAMTVSGNAARPVIGSAAMRPLAVVYRTDRDYSRLVPVTMDAGRKRIAAFPDPSDVRKQGSEPIRLNDGYLLDRRGIGPNTAFLSITYDEYSRMSAAPSPDSLLSRIVSTRPFTAMYALPVTADKAMRTPSLCNGYIDNGFAGCHNLLESSSQ